MTDAELKKLLSLLRRRRVAMTGMPGYNFVMTMSALDCTGCGSCVNVCPDKKGNKALSMMP